MTYFDPVEVEAASKAIIDELKPYLDAPGNVGVQARLLTACGLAFDLARAAERSRETSASDLVIGVAALVSNMIISVVRSVDDQPAATKFMLTVITETLQSKHVTIAGAERVVAPKQEGHA